MKEFSSGITHKRWKDYQVVTHNTYYGGHNETEHHVIFPMTEHMARHLAFYNFATPVLGTMREVLDNNTTPRDKISLNFLGMTIGKFGGAYMMVKTGM